MVLKDINKGLRVSQMIKGVEATLRAGAHSGLNIIFGNIGNSRETLNKAVESFYLSMRTVLRCVQLGP